MDNKSLESATVKLAPHLLDQIDTFAAQHSISRSEAMRFALSVGMPLLNKEISPDIRRLILLLENLNLGVTLLLDKEHSDKLDKIAEIAEDHVQRFHG